MGGGGMPMAGGEGGGGRGGLGGGGSGGGAELGLDSAVHVAALRRSSARYMSGLLAPFIARLTRVDAAMRPAASETGEKAWVTIIQRPLAASHTWLEASDETLSSTVSALISSV